MEEEPLFKTKIGKDDIWERTSCWSCAGAEARLCGWWLRARLGRAL